MINLSEIKRQNQPPLRRLKSLLTPDYYSAEDIAEYKREAPKLQFPWYKRFDSPVEFMHRAYIIIQSVGLTKIQTPPNWVVVHDSSGEELVYWNDSHDLVPALTSPDEFKEEDWAYEVCIRYIIPKEFASIAWADRSRPVRRVREEGLEKITGR